MPSLFHSTIHHQFHFYIHCYFILLCIINSFYYESWFHVTEHRHVILLFVISSFYSHALEEIFTPNITIKIIDHQWYIYFDHLLSLISRLCFSCLPVMIYFLFSLFFILFSLVRFYITPSTYFSCQFCSRFFTSSILHFHFLPLHIVSFLRIACYF